MNTVILLCLLVLLAVGVVASRHLARSAAGPVKARNETRLLSEARWTKLDQRLYEAKVAKGSSRWYHLVLVQALFTTILEDFRESAEDLPTEQQALASAVNQAAMATDRLWNASQRRKQGDQLAADYWLAEALRHFRAASAALRSVV